jgi:Protein of unknown function (DUF2752)
MIRWPQRRIATTVRAATPLTLVAAAAAVLLRFPPTQSAFYPQCPIYAALHLTCPGCGGTRALAALLRGHLGLALHFNALITLALPFAVGYGIVCYWRLLQGKVFRWPQPPLAAIVVTTSATVIFTILRNLPLGARALFMWV